jgi:hypothetical protein
LSFETYFKKFLPWALLLRRSVRKKKVMHLESRNPDLSTVFLMCANYMVECEKTS